MQLRRGKKVAIVEQYSEKWECPEPNRLTNVLALMATLVTTPPSLGPAPGSNLRLTAPIKTWDEAAPLGNGMMGALLWGEGNTIKVSLDRGDVWDLREQGLTVSPAWTYALAPSRR